MLQQQPQQINSINININNTTNNNSINNITTTTATCVCCCLVLFCVAYLAGTKNDTLGKTNGKVAGSGKQDRYPTIPVISSKNETSGDCGAIRTVLGLILGRISRNRRRV